MSSRRLTPAFLAEIARQYNAHTAAQWPPVQAIAVAYRVPRGTAAWWVAKCRRAGLHVESGLGLRHHYAGRGDRP